jgi:hypothetical protein
MLVMSGPLLVSGYAMLARPAATVPPWVDLEEILICEGVERAECLQLAIDAQLFAARHDVIGGQRVIALDGWPSRAAHSGSIGCPTRGPRHAVSSTSPAASTS